MSARQRRIAALGLKPVEARVLELLTAHADGAEWEWAQDDAVDVLVIDPMVPFTHPTIQRSLDTGTPILVGYRRPNFVSQVRTLHLISPVDFHALLALFAEVEIRLRAAILRDERLASAARIPGAGHESDATVRVVVAAPLVEAAPVALPPSVGPQAVVVIAPAVAPVSVARRVSIAELVAQLRGLVTLPLGAYALRFGNRESVALFMPERIVVARRGILLSPTWLTDEITTAQGDFGLRELDDDEAVDPCWDNDRFDVDLLLWSAAGALPAGEFLPEIAARSTFKLRRWPDFGAVGSSLLSFRMAAMLSRATLDLPSLIQVANDQSDDVLRFLNSCAACGYLNEPDAQPAAVLAVPRAASGVRGLIGRMRRALGLG